MNANGNKAQAYWAKVEDTSEKALRKVVKKFGLKFATLVADSEPDAASKNKAIRDEGELLGLTADQGDGLGWATFYFYA